MCASLGVASRRWRGVSDLRSALGGIGLADRKHMRACVRVCVCVKRALPRPLCVGPPPFVSVGPQVALLQVYAYRVFALRNV